MAIKRRLFVPLLLSGSSILLFCAGYKGHQQAILPPALKEINEIPSQQVENKENMWKGVQELLEADTINGIATIDFIQGEIEQDRYGRYFITGQILGIEEAGDINLYDSYMIIQQKEQGNYMILPLGIEFVRSDIEPIKKDITASMMKVANGWDIPYEEFENKWMKKAGKVTLSEEIYDIQAVITFMTGYIEKWPKILRTYDVSWIKGYYHIEDVIYHNYEKALQFLKTQELQVELYDAEIMEISHTKNLDVFQVMVRGKFQTCTMDAIQNRIVDMIYKIKKIDSTFIITDVLSKINE